MELYLLPHGLALSPAEDPEQPLSRAGIDQIKAVAAMMKRLGIAVDTLVASGEKRSRQSAALIAEGINYPYSDILESPLAGPAATLEELQALLLPLLDRPAVLIAGHRPSLARLVAALLASAPDRLQLEPGAFGHWTISAVNPFEARMHYWLNAELLRRFASSFSRG